MDAYETMYVINSANTMKAWQDFAQFFKTLMQQHVANSTKNVIFIAHTLTTLNEADMVMETKVPIKGSLKNTGIESYFSAVISTRRMTIKDLGTYKSKMLNISPEEEMLGFKYCFQNKLTKDTIHSRIRSPMGMFKTEETFTDNCVQQTLDHLHKFYS